MGALTNGIPEKTIERLSEYRRTLLASHKQGIAHIFSHVLAGIHGITAVQVRRDLMLIGFSSDTKKGYDVQVLIEYISKILDSPTPMNIAVLGMGHLGQAITKYFNGKGLKLKITASFDVDPEKVAVVGFSAGGFICASLAAQWKTGPFAALTGERPDHIRPDAVVLGYPLLDMRVMRDERTRDPRIDLRVPKTGGKTGRDLLNDFISMVIGGEATDERMAEVCPTTHVSRDMPPPLVWGTADDRTCPIIQVYDLAGALARAGVAHELHVFDRGGHGLSVADVNTRADNADEQAAVRPWVDLACAFLERIGC